VSLKEDLYAQLRHFDDEAFAALANRGLLRRAQKDVEKEAPQVTAQTPEALTVRAGGFDITFDKRGPAQAKCTCPATSVCQHILAAALALQKLALAEGGQPARAQAAPPAKSPRAADESVAPPPDEPTPSPDKAAPVAETPATSTPRAVAAPAELVSGVASLHESLMLISTAELRGHAGKAGYAWAWQYVQDLADDELELRAEKNIGIGLRHPRVVFRYMGGGIGSLIADLELKQVEKYRAAAVMAYQKAHGAAHPAPEAKGAKPATGALDLGRDHDIAGSDLDDSRARLRQSVRQLCAECLQLGLSHLSPAMQERFSTLAVWAQGAEYYRMALLLRRIADHVDLLLGRAGGADEYRLLDELSLLRALVQALSAGSPVHLVGQSRSTYEEIGSLDLIALGALPWRSASGYLGLSMVFWSAKDAQFFTSTDARPELQRFDPISRYRAPGPWGGIASPQAMTGRLVRLVKPQANRAGRLSQSAQCSGTTVEITDWAAALPPAASDWAELTQGYAQARRSLLAQAQPHKDWCLLAPASFNKPVFDETRQRLDWWLEDAQGRGLRASLVFSKYTQHAITRIEQFAANPPAPGTMIVGRLSGGAADLAFEPVSLVWREPKWRVDALHFDEGEKQGTLSRWLDKLKGTAAAQSSSPAVPQAALVPAQMRELRHWLRQQAERGMPREAQQVMHEDAQWRGQLRQQLQRCAQLGLTAFEPAVPGINAPPPAEQVLRANYLCMQYERLLVGAEEEE
jgi:hypothetical protein